MTTADLAQSPFGTRIASGDEKHNREAVQHVIVESRCYGAKEFLDRILALALLIPALPIIGLLIVVVRFSSRGPAIYRQTRVGKGGRVFTMFKLRSMRVDAEYHTGPVWANVAKDIRVTFVGNWLRRLHFDELPQLYNVVRGEMSLVGPRPERPEFVDVLAKQIPGYLTRLTVQPGITGLAQVNLPPDTDLESVHSKLVLDCEYIRTASLGLDLRILACTILRVVGLRGGLGTKLLGLKRIVILPPEIAAINGGDGPVSATPQMIRTAETAEISDFAFSRRVLETCPEAAEQSN